MINMAKIQKTDEDMNKLVTLKYRELENHINQHVTSAVMSDDKIVAVVCQIANDKIVTRCDGGAVGAQEAVLFHSLEDGQDVNVYEIAESRSRKHIRAILEIELGVEYK